MMEMKKKVMMMLLMGLRFLAIWETWLLETAGLVFPAHVHSDLNKMISEKAKDPRSASVG